MRPFLTKLALWAVPLLIVYIGVMAYYAPRMGEEYYYRKLTVPQSPSFILGSSRALFGLKPDVFSGSSLPFARPIQNFAFSADASPYGPSYLRAIQHKLAPGSTNGLFILEVSLMNLSQPKGAREVKDSEPFLGGMHCFSMAPNFEYLLRFYDKPYYSVVLQAYRPCQGRLQADGWVESEVSRWAPDRVDLFIKSSEEYMRKVELSPARLAALEQTISYLQAHGRVVLVRMPAGDRRRALEDAQAPELRSRLQSLARRTHSSYVDFWDELSAYQTFDECHLNRESAARFSRALLAKIQGAG